MASRFVLVWSVVAVGCSDGCAEPDDEERPQQVDEVWADDAVVVARFDDFDKRHFDIQHWWAEAVQSGRLTGRDDVAGGIAEKPTTRFREFVDEVFDARAEGIDWQQGIDVVVWRPGQNNDNHWRWAVSLSVDSEFALTDRDRWQRRESIATGGDDAPAVEVFARTNGDPSDLYAGLSAGGAEDTSTVVLSNVEKGGVHIGDAVELTGDSGVEAAELYVWPRRLGLGERYGAMANRMEQKLAKKGHSTLPVQSAIGQLQTRLVRAGSADSAWPEVARLWLEIERDEETSGATQVELKIDAFTAESRLFSTLEEATEGAGDRVDAELVGAGDAVATVDVAMTERGWGELLHRGLDREWRYAPIVGTPARQEETVRAFEKFIDHNAGPTTLGFYESKVPTGMTGDLYVSWKTRDGDRQMEAARGFHRRLMEDIWKPLFRVDDFARREHLEIDIDGQTLEAEQKTLFIGHGHGELGVCWTVRGQEYLSYYGVFPCNRLSEIVEESSRVATFDTALSYEGDLRRLAQTLYLAPGVEFEDDLYEGVDVDIDADWSAEEYLRVTATFDDLPTLAKAVEATPRLAGQWDVDTMFRSEAPGTELNLDVTRFQEPGLMSVGVPGWGGLLPASFFLGIPLSHPPTPATPFRRLFFADPGDHHHHHHHH